jgi:hypothetical protein
MPDSHNDNHNPFPVDTVHDAIVADANTKMVSLRFELFAAGGNGSSHSALTFSEILR